MGYDLTIVCFSFQVSQVKQSVQGARLYLYIGVHLALDNEFEYQEFAYSQESI